jgi:hypothetical protein
MLLKIISIIFGATAVVIFIWKFKETQLCRPFINSRVAPDFPKNDGKQTPMGGHPVFIAQHATATCCRKCIQKWQGIEKGRVLNVAKIDFIVALIMGWIQQQIIGKSHINIKPSSLT